MTNLLDQAIKKLGRKNIERIDLNICDNNVIKGKTVEEILKEHCGVYTVSIKTKDGKYYGDIAYVHASVGKKFIEKQKEHTNWQGTGTYKGITLLENLTGGACIFCIAKKEEFSIDQALNYAKNAYSGDPYNAYIKPNLKEIINFKQKFNL